MRLLLDTCTFLWMLAEPEKLSPRASAALSQSRIEVYLSAVSSFEIAVKAGLGKLSLPETPAAFVPRHMLRNSILPVVLDHAHALHVHSLPPHHSDPFDRPLIAQAQLEGLTLVTPDAAFADYDVAALW